MSESKIWSSSSQCTVASTVYGGPMVEQLNMIENSSICSMAPLEAQPQSLAAGPTLRFLLVELPLCVTVVVRD